MRIMVIVLGSFVGLVLVLHAALPLRLNELIEGRAHTIEAGTWLAFVCVWAGATALVYTAPRFAVWLFAIAGVIGLFVGAITDDRLLIIWGAVASGLAVLATLARREKRVADRAEWQKEQREVAVHLALRSLQETVPELLARIPDTDPGSPVPIRPVPARPITSGPVPARRQTDFVRDA